MATSPQQPAKPARPGVSGSAVNQYRFEWYRDNFRRMAALAIGELGVILLLGVVVGWQATHQPEPRYFATTADGQVIAMVPLGEPNVSQSTLLQWASVAAVSAYTYDFVNYRSQLQAIADNFTPNGWDSFTASLKDSGTIDAVTSKRMVVSAAASGAPVIVAQGPLAGTYSWKVQIPLLVSFQSASEIKSRKMQVTLLIQRQSTLTSPRGIGIAQFIVVDQG